MSVQSNGVVIRCDGERCGLWIATGQPSVEAARAWLLEWSGWWQFDDPAIGGGTVTFDYCERHPVV